MTVDFRFAEAGDVQALKALIESLCRKYGVSQSVARWKLEHGLDYHDIDILSLLDSVVPQR